MYFLERVIYSDNHKHWFWDTIQASCSITHLVGGVVGIVSESPSSQGRIPVAVPTVLLSVGGSGYDAVLAMRFVWTIGKENVHLGVKQIVVWFQERKYRPTATFTGCWIAAFIAAVPLTLLDIRIYVLVSLLTLWCTYNNGLR